MSREFFYRINRRKIGVLNISFNSVRVSNVLPTIISACNHELLELIAFHFLSNLFKRVINLSDCSYVGGKFINNMERVDFLLKKPSTSFEPLKKLSENCQQVSTASCHLWTQPKVVSASNVIFIWRVNLWITSWLRQLLLRWSFEFWKKFSWLNRE